MLYIGKTLISGYSIDNEHKYMPNFIGKSEPMKILECQVFWASLFCVKLAILLLFVKRKTQHGRF